MTSQNIGRKGDHNIKLNHGKYNKQAAETYKNILISLHKPDATCIFKKQQNDLKRTLQGKKYYSKYIGLCEMIRSINYFFPGELFFNNNFMSVVCTDCRSDHSPQILLVLKVVILEEIFFIILINSIA